MTVSAAFVEQVRDAYEHLYDLVYLRTHPISNFLITDATLSHKDRAWRCHHLLLEAIDELDPGPKAPVFSREWRRHRLMVLRYVDGLDVQAVADHIAIGRRHYYREHEAAIASVAQVLWDHHGKHSPAPQLGEPSDAGSASLTRIEMLRLEVARAAQAGRRVDLAEVLEGVLPILQDRLTERKIEIEVDLPARLPRLASDRSLLRQLLLGLLGHIVERVHGASLEVTAQSEREHVSLTIAFAQTSWTTTHREDAPFELPAALTELAAIGDISIQTLRSASQTGVILSLPMDPPRTILVVDDNEDTIELMYRYLTLHQYQVLGTTSAIEALEQAQTGHPHAIILDLMMPGYDGWDLLKRLLADPSTQRIPVIVCSVLRQRELALSLGAAAFLEKPVTEQALLQVLEGLSRS